MPVSVIDPTCALIVVDLQKGLADAATAHPVPDVVHNAASLAAAFRDQRLPVVLVTASGRAPGRTEVGGRNSGGDFPPEFYELMDELAPASSDLRVIKQRWGAFTNTDLDAQLRAGEVTQVVIVGIATSAGVESTARSAHEYGYHVVLAVDAMTDRDGEAHDNSVRRIFPKLGETGSTAEVLALLSAR